MKQNISLMALIVRDYDEAIAFYVGTLGFDLIDDTYQPGQDKRWVVVRPRGAEDTGILLAQASSEEQARFVGNQAGGRVMMFLQTDDFDRDFTRYQATGVEFVRPPTVAPYGKVAVFKDLYGNLWDLIEYS